MSPRPGTVSKLVQSATALGVAAGVNVPLNNSAFAVLPAISIVLVASATVGNRVPVVRLLDASGNILASTVATTAITAGQTVRLMVMAGATFSAIATPLQQNLPWPVEMPVPPLSSLQIFDNANVDVADTVAVVASFAM